MSSLIETARGFDRIEGDTTLRVEFLEPGIIRVRKWAGAEPPLPDLIRYGFFRDDWPEASVQVTRTGAASDLLRVSVDAEGRLRIADADGDELLAETEPALPGPEPGFRLRFGLSPQSRLTGLGDQNRERIDHRGMSGDLWGRNVSSYIPIPLLISSDGYGVLLNTTRRVLYDLGATSDDWFGFEAEGQSADWYFIYGPSPAETLDRYTQVTGRPMMPPRWAMGLWFICRTQADAHEFISDCLNLRREGIPCDAIGLEPGWMERNYDYSLDKRWSDERFPIPRSRVTVAWRARFSLPPGTSASSPGCGCATITICLTRRSVGSTRRCGRRNSGPARRSPRATRWTRTCAAGVTSTRSPGPTSPGIATWRSSWMRVPTGSSRTARTRFWSIPTGFGATE
jgi:hypothetical protein